MAFHPSAIHDATRCDSRNDIIEKLQVTAHENERREEGEGEGISNGELLVENAYRPPI